MQPATGSAAFASPEELATRLFNSAVGAFDLFAVYLGDRLGFYRALADGGPANCGGCAIVCAEDGRETVTRIGAVCRGTCKPGFADRDGDPTNGCET